MSAKQLLHLSLSRGQVHTSGFVYLSSVPPADRSQLRPWISFAASDPNTVSLPRGFRSPDLSALVHCHDDSLMCVVMDADSQMKIIIGVCGRRAGNDLWKFLLEQSSIRLTPRPDGPWLAVAYPHDDAPPEAWHQPFAERLAWSYLAP